MNKELKEKNNGSIEKYNGRFVVRLAPSVHYQLARNALQKETSLNQVVTEVINSYLLQTV